MVLSQVLTFLAYLLSIIFLGQYINVHSIDLEFVKNVSIIVAVSWLPVHLMQVLARWLNPTDYQKVMRTIWFAASCVNHSLLCCCLLVFRIHYRVKWRIDEMIVLCSVKDQTNKLKSIFLGDSIFEIILPIAYKIFRISILALLLLFFLDSTFRSTYVIFSSLPLSFRKTKIASSEIYPSWRNQYRWNLQM